MSNRPKTARPTTSRPKTAAPKTSYTTRPTTAAPNGSRGHSAKNREETTSMITEALWVNRIEKELRTAKEWEKNWECIVDPKLYVGESGPQTFPHKDLPEKWSPAHMRLLPSSTATLFEGMEFMEFDNEADKEAFKNSPKNTRPSSADYLVHSKVLAVKTPQEKYRAPVTTSQEYGWKYGTRQTLEIFGRATR